MRLRFTITQGRTGTGYLAKLYQMNDTAPAYHEMLGYSQFGVNTPDLSTMTLFNSQGFEHVRDFWALKWRNMISEGSRTETCHRLAKCGLIESLAYAPEWAEIDLIILKRDFRKTVKSFRDRGDFLNMGNMWLWYLDPAYPRNLTDRAPFDGLGPLGSVCWYYFEMAVRAERYKNMLKDRPNVNIHEVRLEDITKEDGALDLLRRTGVDCDTVKIPPKTNANTRSYPLSVQEESALNVIATQITDEHIKELGC